MILATLSEGEGYRWRIGFQSYLRFPVAFGNGWLPVMHLFTGTPYRVRKEYRGRIQVREGIPKVKEGVPVISKEKGQLKNEG